MSEQMFPESSSYYGPEDNITELLGDGPDPQFEAETRRHEEELATQLEEQRVRMLDAERTEEALPTFFAAVDEMPEEQNDFRKKEVGKVVDHIIKTGNAHLVARHMGDFLSRSDQEQLAHQLANNNYAGIVNEHLNEFDNPEEIRKNVIPGYISF